MPSARVTPTGNLLVIIKLYHLEILIRALNPDDQHIIIIKLRTIPGILAVSSLNALVAFSNLLNPDAQHIISHITSILSSRNGSRHAPIPVHRNTVSLKPRIRLGNTVISINCLTLSVKIQLGVIARNIGPSISSRSIHHLRTAGLGMLEYFQSRLPISRTCLYHAAIALQGTVKGPALAMPDNGRSIASRIITEAGASIHTRQHPDRLIISQNGAHTVGIEFAAPFDVQESYSPAELTRNAILVLRVVMERTL